MINDEDEFLFYTEDNEEDNPSGHQRHYKILVVDDEPGVHEVTQLALEGFVFEDRDLEILHAYSGQEAQDILSAQSDIAVVLLDVVMETTNAGLVVADWIRQTLGNKKVRVVLRTGQPGDAPEEKVIVKYDIHDYKEKTELTNRKLNTLLHSCLRAYRDIETIDRSCTQLSEIISLSEFIFKKQDIHSFCKHVLDVLLKLLADNKYESLLMVSSFQVVDETIVHATGRFKGAVSNRVDDYFDLLPFNQLNDTDGADYAIVDNNFYCKIKRKEHQILVFIEELTYTEEIDNIILRMFMNYVSVGYENEFSEK
jgi:CheY-like chemotaxis protein